MSTLTNKDLAVALDLAPFFGNQKGTGEFVSALYSDGNYTMPANTPDSPDLVKALILYQLMLAKNYEQASKVTGMKDEDVHQDFCDFIIRTALYHKELDYQTTSGSSLAGFRASFEDSAKRALEIKLDSGLLTKSDYFNDLLTKAIFDTTVYDEFGNGKLNNYFPDVNVNKDDFYSVVIKLLILLTPIIYINNGNTLPKTSQALSALTLKDVITDGMGNFENLTFGQIAESLIGKCKDHSSGSRIGQICMMAFFDPSSPDTAASKNIRALIDRINSTNSKSIENAFMADLRHFLEMALVDFANILYSEEGQNIIKIFDEYDATTDKPKLTVIYNKLSGQAYRSQLINMITNNANSAITGAVNSLGLQKFSTTENEASYQFWSRVYQNWNNLQPYARDFYRANAHLFRKTGKTELSNDIDFTGWTDMNDPNNEQALAQPIKQGDKDFRVNIMKVTPGSATTVFENKLPFVPLNLVGDLYYTNSSGQVVKVPKADLTADSFKQLYNCTLLGKQCSFGSSTFMPPTSFSMSLAKDNGFRLVSSTFIRNYLIDSKNQELHPASSSNGSNSFDDLFVNMNTGLTYQRDANGLFRMEGNVRKDYNVFPTSDDFCLGTRLRTSDNKQCAKFVRECLIGDMSTLSLCLEGFSNQDLFNVAQSELQNVDPNVAIVILKKFGVRKGDVNGVIMAEDYDHWYADVLQKSIKEDVRSVLEKNGNLLNYLKGVISFVNNNKAILNPGMTKEAPTPVLGTVDNEYLKQLGMNYYVLPLGNTKEAKLFAGQALWNTVNSPMNMPSFTALNSMYNAVTNTIIQPGSAFPTSFGMLSGGGGAFETFNRKADRGELTNSDVIYAQLANTYADLKNNGYSLRDVDQKRLDDGIKQLTKTEGRLIDLHNLLRKFANLAMFFKSSGCSTKGTSMREISIEMLRSKEDAINFLEKNITDLQSCITNNVSNQNSLATELMNQFIALTDTANGKANSSVVSANGVLSNM